MKLGIITPDAFDACSLYRSVGPYMKMPVELSVYSGKNGFCLWEAVLKNDIILLQRPYTPQHATIAQTIKAVGKKLIVDWDDQLDVVPQWNPHVQAFANCLPNLEAVAQLADVVTVTTAPLKHAAQRWGAKRVDIISNAIDDSLKLPKRERTKTLAWRGSNTHVADVELAKDAILKAAADGYAIAFFGDRPPWAYQIQHKYYGVSDYVQYMATLAQLAPEYLIVTLADHPFNHSKSDIAAQECWAVGAKLIHNGIGEFAGLPEWQEPRKLSEMNALRIDILNSLM